MDGDLLAGIFENDEAWFVDVHPTNGQINCDQIQSGTICFDSNNERESHATSFSNEIHLNVQSKKNGRRWDDPDATANNAKRFRQHAGSPPVNVINHASVQAAVPYESAPILNQLRVIPANDIRREYPSLFFDALNHADHGKLKQLFTNHCVNNLVITMKTMQSNGSPNQTTYLEIQGRPAVTLLSSYFIDATPDCIYELQQTKIDALANGNTTIKCYFTKQGTKVVDMIVDKGSWLVLSGPQSTLPLPHCKDGLLLVPIDGEQRHVIGSLLPFPRIVQGMAKSGPMFIQAKGTMTFSINPNKEIFLVELFYTVMEPVSFKSLITSTGSNSK